MPRRRSLRFDEDVEKSATAGGDASSGRRRSPSTVCGRDHSALWEERKLESHQKFESHLNADGRQDRYLSDAVSEKTDWRYESARTDRPSSSRRDSGVDVFSSRYGGHTDRWVDRQTDGWGKDSNHATSNAGPLTRECPQKTGKSRCVSFARGLLASKAYR